MSKQYNIRWTRSDYSKLTHLVKKVNTKVLNVEVKRPDIAQFQPDMLDYHTLKSQIKTRRDFNNLINKYERYLREGAEEVIKTKNGGQLTEWQKNEIKIFDLVENSKKARTRKRLEEKEVTIGGKGTGKTRAEMGTIKENEVKSRTHNVNNMSQKDLDKLFRLMEKKMSSTYEDKAKLNKLIHYCAGLENQGLGDIVEIMKHIPVDKFIELLDTDEIADFGFIYDPIELNVRRDRLREFWESHIDTSVNHNIEYFGVDENGEQILIRL